MEVLIIVMVLGVIVFGLGYINSASKKATRRHYAKYNVESAPEVRGILSDMVSDCGMEIGDPEWKNLRESRKINKTLNKQSQILNKIANNNSGNTDSELHERIRQLEEIVSKLQQNK